MFTTEFRTKCLYNYIELNVITILIATIVECCTERSIFKPTTKKQNEKYWNKRVFEAVKAFVFSIPTFWTGAIYQAAWDLHYAKVYCHHPEFHFGRFLIQIFVYLALLDTLNYWYHRMYHIRTPIDLYKHIHWFHHQFNPITSYATFALHPIFTLGATAFHFAVAMIASWIFPFDPVSHQIAGFLVMLFTLISHDGTFCEDHMTHHDTVNFNFASGFSTFWDKIGNTYKAGSERRSRRAKRIRLNEL